MWVSVKLLVHFYTGSWLWHSHCGTDRRTLWLVSNLSELSQVLPAVFMATVPATSTAAASGTQRKWDKTLCIHFFPPTWQILSQGLVLEQRLLWFPIIFEIGCGVGFSGLSSGDVDTVQSQFLEVSHLRVFLDCSSSEVETLELIIHR